MFFPRPEENNTRAAGGSANGSEDNRSKHPFANRDRTSTCSVSNWFGTCIPSVEAPLQLVSANLLSIVIETGLTRTWGNS